MKFKRFAALVCGMTIAFSSVAFATVENEKIGIGDVTPGMRVADLIATHGEPNIKVGDNWYYSNFKVEVDKRDSPNIVEEVSSRNVTLGTMGGVKIGQQAVILNEAYGKADMIQVNGSVEEYEYFNSDYTRKMKFTVHDGVIMKISCEIID